MKIIRNKFIPVPGFKAINLWGFVFARKDAVIYNTTINHEAIHTRQIAEVMALFAIPFMLFNIPLAWLIPWVFSYYILYIVEFLIRFAIIRNWKAAYRSISFEREAYANEIDDGYLIGRGVFGFVRYC